MPSKKIVFTKAEEGKYRASFKDWIFEMSINYHNKWELFAQREVSAPLAGCYYHVFHDDFTSTKVDLRTLFLRRYDADLEWDL